MNAPADVEYRIAHLKDRLAAEETGELGIRIENRGSSVTVVGTVPTAHCREELMGTVNDELSGLTVRFDVVVADSAAPDHSEEVL
ncbi:hypothetical protein E6P78_07410 [Streptomyces sp. A0958]|uniref:hypothetical protein n=1 Tax=Streptomyces sp. A0958 TaxID=2563101 RepID=UPI00109E5F8D|nr:hypothetical protein [Streptomyces sp. A0958]THA71069.1 hypothetical protein E6P78_07410 [Streptomyces sp. A0958]